MLYYRDAFLLLSETAIISSGSMAFLRPGDWLSFHRWKNTYSHCSISTSLLPNPLRSSQVRPGWICLSAVTKLQEHIFLLCRESLIGGNRTGKWPAETVYLTIHVPNASYKVQPHKLLEHILCTLSLTALSPFKISLHLKTLPSNIRHPAKLPYPSSHTNTKCFTTTTSPSSPSP